MNAQRLQHLVPAASVFVLAAVVTYLSFTQQPVESFLFPRIISVAFISLATWNLARAALGLAKVGNGLTLPESINIAPGLLIMLLFVFFAAKMFGFYVASFAAFFLVYSVYDPVPVFDLKHWIKRIIITAAFMAVIYALFALLLQVQTPRGLFF